MEEKLNDKSLLGKFLDLDISSPQRKELIKRFEKLSPTEKQGIINSICKKDWQSEETSEAFEVIISLLKCNDVDLEEEEEEEEEDSDHSSDVCDKCNKLKDKRDDILSEKLLSLFKAIYNKDPELDKITTDAFECMKDKKITGNICPHIKRAIQQCLRVKKEEINRLWMTELTETVNGEKQLKSVKDNVESYIKLTRELINTYKEYNESISKIVEVWKPMLNSPK